MRSSPSSKVKDEDNEPRAKKPRREHLDLVVVVGGIKEYPESSKDLRQSSGYFEAAFQRGTEEARKMRFEFPDEDPIEWMTVREFLKPNPTGQVTEGIFKEVLPWFDKLNASQGLQECDKVCSRDLLPEITKNCKYHTHVPELIHLLELCIRHKLEQSQASGLVSLVSVMKDNPSALHLRSLEYLTRIIVSTESSFRKKMLDALKPWMGPIADKQTEELLQTGFFPNILYANLATEKTKKKVYRVGEIVNSYSGSSIPTLKLLLASDNDSRELFTSVGISLEPPASNGSSTD